MNRPYRAFVPSRYDGAQATPLVILLHGYTGSGESTSDFFKLSATAESGGFLLAFPDGTMDKRGQRFWNATDACCNFHGSRVDDVAYLGALIDDLSAHYRVDPRRVYVLGHSNGGFMAERLACDLAPRIAAIVDISGDGWADPGRCRPETPVAMLHIHGDADEVIQYEGGDLAPQVPDASEPPGAYPTALESARFWAWRNGCEPGIDGSAPPRDLDARVRGAETRVQRWLGCKGGSVELWTIHGGGHAPRPSASYGAQLWEFLSRQRKP